MSVYVVAQLKFTDLTAYRRYQARFMEVLGLSNGRLLAADEHPRVLEGEWSRDKVVMLVFPDEKSFTAWSTSAEYQEILQDRKAGAQAIVLLVHGVK